MDLPGGNSHQGGVMEDLYHRMLTVPTGTALAVLAATYFALNAIFAGLYNIAPAGSLPGVESFSGAFDFSIQTFSTIGYGAISPVGSYANAVVAVESLAGILYVALATGVVFARFSRPVARVEFCNTAVINCLDGGPQLRLRVRNERANQIVEAKIHLTLLRKEKLADGSTFLRFHDLKVVRSSSPFFVLSWLVMHPIDQDSPFYGVSPEQLEAWDSEVLVTLTGLDGTMSQQIHARTSYSPQEIVFGRRLANVLIDHDGSSISHWERFHHTDALPDEVGLPPWLRATGPAKAQPTKR